MHTYLDQAPLTNVQAEPDGEPLAILLVQRMLYQCIRPPVVEDRRRYNMCSNYTLEAVSSYTPDVEHVERWVGNLY